MSDWEIKEAQVEHGTRSYKVVSQREINEYYTLWVAPNVTTMHNYRWEYVTVDASLELRVLAQGLGVTLKGTQAAADRWLLRHVAALAQAVLPKEDK